MCRLIKVYVYQTATQNPHKKQQQTTKQTKSLQQINISSITNNHKERKQLVHTTQPNIITKLIPTDTKHTKTEQLFALNWNVRGELILTFTNLNVTTTSNMILHLMVLDLWTNIRQMIILSGKVDLAGFGL